MCFIVKPLQSVNSMCEYCVSNVIQSVNSMGEYCVSNVIQSVNSMGEYCVSNVIQSVNSMCEYCVSNVIKLGFGAFLMPIVKFVRTLNPVIYLLLMASSLLVFTLFPLQESTRGSCQEILLIIDNISLFSSTHYGPEGILFFC